jgi:transcription-repair coupling factor (superfamily II helicase)
MVKEKLKKIIQSSPSVLKARALLTEGKVVKLKGVVGSLKSLLLANFFEQFSTQVVYLCYELEDAEVVREDLEKLVGHPQVAFFPPTDYPRFGLAHSSQTAKANRLSALEALAEKRPLILVVHAASLLCKLPCPDRFRTKKLAIEVGEELDFEDTCTRLIDLGFSREPTVESPGEISVRGGIVDVFPYSAQYPVRIEFWGDTVESLREFEPATQRSKRQINRIVIYPQDAFAENHLHDEN